MKTAQVKEPEFANDRITARAPKSIRSIIERAAAIYGATINQFIILEKGDVYLRVFIQPSSMIHIFFDHGSHQFHG